MSAFEASWLALREPADHRSRAHALARLLKRALPRQKQPWRIADLGCGTGSNFRYLAPILGGNQHWTLLDSDPALLDAAPGSLRSWAQDIGYIVEPSDKTLMIHGDTFHAEIMTRQADLSTNPVPIEEPALVTGTALLDLVSQEWIAQLADVCADAQAAALFTLSYDGRIDWTPSDALDDSVRSWVNQHQRGNKGFGAALGPDAADNAARAFHKRDFDVETATSDWHLTSSETELQQYLHAGWAMAASETVPARQPDIQGWLERRIDLLATGTGKVQVGHTDILALPPGA